MIIAYSGLDVNDYVPINLECEVLRLLKGWMLRAEWNLNY